MRGVMKGFTLIELVLVILVLGIVSTSVTSFIRYGAEIYQDVSGRDKQISDSRFVIERITREIRNAVPNSVRVTDDGPGQTTGSCIEFIPILASSSYVEIPVLPDAANDTLTLVASNETFEQGNTKIVVYPLNENDVYIDGGLTSGKLFDISNYNFIDIDAVPDPDPLINSDAYQQLELTLDNTVLFDEDSPTQRYFIIKDSVAYCQNANGNMFRYQGHSFTDNQANQENPPTSTGVLMAERQSNKFPFSLQSATLVRNGIVVMDFSFTYDDEILRQVNEVNIANVP